MVMSGGYLQYSPLNQYDYWNRFEHRRPINARLFDRICG